MTIRPGAEADADACHSLATAVTLAAAGSEATGFLLGRETLADYREFLREGLCWIAQGTDGGPLGFVVAYDGASQLVARHAKPLLQAAWGGPSPLSDPYCYIEKVAVAPGARRSGVARLLYATLFAAVADRPLLAALAESPSCNRASRAFHLASGFTRIGAFAASSYLGYTEFRLGFYLRPPSAPPALPPRAGAPG